MPGPYKVTLLWNFQGSGFSETWYYNITAALGPADLAAISAMSTARNGLTAAFVNLVAYRISDTTNPRQTIVKDFVTVPGGGSNPDTPTNAWLAIARGPAGQGRRQLWMRGIADDWVEWNQANATWKLIGPFKTAFDKFVGIVSKTPWAMRTVKTQAQGAPGVGIALVAPGATNSAPVLTMSGGAAPPGGTLIIGGFRQPLSFLNGTYLYPTGYATGSTTITLRAKTVSQFQCSSYVTGAVVRSQQFNYVTPSTIQLVSPRERRVGRAFFVPRGRRSVSR